MYTHLRYLLSITLLLVGTVGLACAENRVATDDAMKAAVKKAQPEYPPIAKQMRVSGKVGVEVTIDAEGNVENVKIISGNALLTTSVVSAVKKWKFTPFMQDGAPAKTIASLDFDFKL